jgi:hypothetical protein
MSQPANEAAGAKPGLITRLFFVLLKLLKQFGESRFPGSKSSVIRAESAFG